MPLQVRRTSQTIWASVSTPASPTRETSDSITVQLLKVSATLTPKYSLDIQKAALTCVQHGLRGPGR